MEPMTERTNVGLRLTKKEMDFLRADADKQNRTLTNYLRNLIVKEMKSR